MTRYRPASISPGVYWPESIPLPEGGRTTLGDGEEWRFGSTLSAGWAAVGISETELTDSPHDGQNRADGAVSSPQ